MKRLRCNWRELMLITDNVLCRREHVQRRPVRRPPEHLLPQQQRGLREYCFLYMQMWHSINWNLIVFGNHNLKGLNNVLSGNKKHLYQIDWSYALRSFRFVKKLTILYMICKKNKKIGGTVLHGTVAGVTTLGFAGEVRFERSRVQPSKSSQLFWHDSFGKGYCQVKKGKLVKLDNLKSIRGPTEKYEGYFFNPPMCNKNKTCI